MLSYSHIFTCSLVTHSHKLAHTCTHSVIHTHSHFLSYSHSHPLSPTQSHSHPPSCLSHSCSHSLSPTHTSFMHAHSRACSPCTPSPAAFPGTCFLRASWLSRLVVGSDPLGPSAALEPGAAPAAWHCSPGHPCARRGASPHLEPVVKLGLHWAGSWGASLSRAPTPGKRSPNRWVASREPFPQTRTPLPGLPRGNRLSGVWHKGTSFHPRPEAPGLPGPSLELPLGRG